jgi:hypothetical protein
MTVLDGEFSSGQADHAIVLQSTLEQTDQSQEKTVTQNVGDGLLLS